MEQLPLNLSGDEPVKRNRFQWLLDLAKVIDSFRIFPRAFITVYIYMFYRTVDWFMQLPDPNTQQAGLISVITGIGAAWFGLYVNSGKKD